MRDLHIKFTRYAAADANLRLKSRKAAKKDNRWRLSTANKAVDDFLHISVMCYAKL